MEKIFAGLPFGTRCKTRSGELAIYLSTEHYDGDGTENNPPFTFVNFAVERYVKYTSGAEKRFHQIIRTDEYGKFNKYDPEPDDWDIVEIEK